MDSVADELGGQQMPNCKTMSVDQRSRRDREFIKCEYNSRGRIDDYGSRKPIKLNIHSSNKSHRLTGTQPSRKFPQLFKVYTGKEQSPQGCSHSGKPAARWRESEVSTHHWEFIPSDPVKNTAQTVVQQEWFSVINTNEPQWMRQFGNYCVTSSETFSCLRNKTKRKLMPSVFCFNLHLLMSRLRW